MENRVNESNMYCAFVPGRWGKREREKLLWFVSRLARAAEMSHSFWQQVIKKWNRETTSGYPHVSDRRKGLSVLQLVACAPIK